MNGMEMDAFKHGLEVVSNNSSVKDQSFTYLVTCNFSNKVRIIIWMLYSPIPHMADLEKGRNLIKKKKIRFAY